MGPDQDTQLRDLENETFVLIAHLQELKDSLREPKDRTAEEVDHLLNEIDEAKIAIEESEHEVRERRRELEEEAESEAITKREKKALEEKKRALKKKIVDTKTYICNHPDAAETVQGILQHAQVEIEEIDKKLSAKVDQVHSREQRKGDDEKLKWHRLNDEERIEFAGRSLISVQIIFSYSPDGREWTGGCEEVSQDWEGRCSLPDIPPNHLRSLRFHPTGRDHNLSSRSARS